MEKALLLSVLVSIVALPTYFAGAPSPHRALRRLLLAVVLFNVVYLFALLFVWPSLAD